MNTSFVRMAQIVLSVLFLATPRATAQHYVWDPEFGSEGPNGTVHAIAEYDSELFVGGDFTRVGSVSASNVARWVFDGVSGHEWSAAGGGLDGPIQAMIEFDGVLFAGGEFSGAAATWNGTTWSSASAGLPSNLWYISDFEIVNGELFAAVNYFGPRNSRLFRKSSALANWQAYGPEYFAEVNAIASDGTTSNLVALGTFIFDDDLSVSAKVLPSDAEAMPDLNKCLFTGLHSDPRAGAFYNGEFYAGGWLMEADCGTGVWHQKMLSVFRDGIWRYVFEDTVTTMRPDVSTLLVFTEAMDEHLYVGTHQGDVFKAYEPELSEFINRIGRFDGEQWSPLCTGIQNGSVFAMGTWSLGDSLIVGGGFGYAGGMPVAGVARWYFNPCIADWNGDGLLDFFDQLGFQASYAAGDMRADLDCDGELTFFDALEFGNLYGACQ